MSHHRLRADASTSGVHNTNPGENPPGIGPQRVPPEDAYSTEAVSGSSGACGYRLAGRSSVADSAGPTGERTSQPSVKPSSTVRLAGAVNGRYGSPAYAAYALRGWLSASAAVSTRTRRFARWSAIGSLVLGMAGQVAYHLLARARAAHAPWGITTAVSCLPVLVLGHGRRPRPPAPRRRTAWTCQARPGPPARATPQTDRAAAALARTKPQRRPCGTGWPKPN